MIDHISVGVSDLDRSERFYEAALAPLGFFRLVTRPGTIGFGKSYPELGSICDPQCRRCNRTADATSRFGQKPQAKSINFTPPLSTPAAARTVRRA